MMILARSSNGRTTVSGTVYLGSSPSLAADTICTYFSRWIQFESQVWYSYKVEKLKKISYEEVVSFFEKEHPIDETSVHFAGNYWAMKHLEWANDVAKGVWSLCELDSDDIFGIVFSRHTAEDSENILVDEEGMTLRNAVAYLKSHEREYAEQNPDCWSKIMYWQDKPFTPVLLSTKPTPNKGSRSNVNSELGSLFHQDGLHRLIRWGLDGRFEEEAYSKGEKLTAFISGQL